MRNDRSLSTSLLALVLWLAPTASADEAWLEPWGPGGLGWGTSEQPVDVVPTRASRYPDAGFIGQNAKDRPDDLLVSGARAGEERILRYIAGQLTDAWWVVPGRIDTEGFRSSGKLEWQGAVLGPFDEDGWFAVGDATSWDLGDRTALHWVDRAGSREILVSRAKPISGAWAVTRPTRLDAGMPGRGTLAMKGPLKKSLKPVRAELSGCFEQSPKPVEATVEGRYDAKGRLVRVRATVDQPAVDVVGCLAGALESQGGTPGATLSAVLRRNN